MPALVLGPMLRHVGTTTATIWVETDEPCDVTVLETTAPTFCVAKRHYALVLVEGLVPGSTTPYELRLDEQLVWPAPEATDPPSVVRTLLEDGPTSIAFGSCRVSIPHGPPYSQTKDADPRGREVDALVALSARLRTTPHETWPDLLLLLGDQVYADEVSPGVQERIDRSRSSEGPDTPPRGEVADFEEYAWLYEEAWRDPPIRWLLSTVSSAMIFDDHDVHDDWNTSQAWVDEQRKVPWWRERILGAYASYWLYQHLGNLSPEELAEDALYQRVRQGGDHDQAVRDFAQTAEDEVAGTRWSFRRDLGATRLVVLDSRAGRVLDDAGRQMLSDDEWAWAREQCSPSFEGGFDHLVVATSLPWLLAPGLHQLEAWNERVAGGAWGARAARAAEKLRQGLDLEHWAAFNGCFDRLTALLADVGAGRRGPAPKTICVLSGDVHHAYVAEARFRDPDVTSTVVQAVCSPIRNPLDHRERRALRGATSRPAAAFGRVLAKLAGVPREAVRWRFTEAPTFDNQIASLELDPRGAHVTIEKTLPADWRDPTLRPGLTWSSAA